MMANVTDRDLQPVVALLLDNREERLALRKGLCSGH